MTYFNQTSVCKEIESLFDTSSSCFDDIIRPNITDCDLLISIYRWILIDCYIERLFFPTAAILVVIGTILNLFSLYCFLKMNKRNSQNVYLSALSLGDTINLHINFTIPLLRQINRFDEFFHRFNFLCKMNSFLTEFFLIFPTWIVVLLTFERLICILWPLKCFSLYTHKRAKISIFILALTVTCLCFYRFYDVKGIDQTSVFAIAACDGNSTKTYPALLYTNLIIWAILPEVLTLIMNLVIIYSIKLATQQFEPFYSKARQTKYNQATKTVLLISILFLICHTPTGILIVLNLLYSTRVRTISLTMILVLRKVTVILYEISLCCKFFVYNLTFRNFKDIFHTSLSRFTRQTNSAKLGRPNHGKRPVHYHHGKSIQFGPIKRHQVFQTKETDVFVRHHRSSTSTSRASRGEQQAQSMSIVVMKMNSNHPIPLVETPNLLRRGTLDTKSNRLLCRCKPQITL